jgi:hypothetical protein
METKACNLLQSKKTLKAVLAAVVMDVWKVN